MTDDPLIGRQLANFRVERLLGRGGMGSVYYGWDVQLDRPVAIKVVDVAGQGTVSYAKRLVQEARAVAPWRHEHIVQVYYADAEDTLYYFVMEHIDGQNLGEHMAEYVAQGEYMPYDEVLRFGEAIASALDYSHQQGVIHRDVKPANVMIAGDGQVVLTDFGLALDVEQGTVGEVFGSAHYIAPEQARSSADAVPQSDLYSLGIILYEMLTGVVPFDDPSPMSTALQHMTKAPPPPRQINPALNAATEAVLLKALGKTPAQRYQTGEALLEALKQALQPDRPQPAASPPLPPTPAAAPQPPPPPPVPATAPQPAASPPPPPRAMPQQAVPAPARIAARKPARPAARPRRTSSSVWPIVGGLVLLLGIVAVLVAAFIGRDYLAALLPLPGDSSNAEVTQPAIVVITEVVTMSVTANVDSPTAASVVAETAASVAVETPAPATSAPAETEISTPAPVATEIPVSPTEASTDTPSVAPIATILYPDGYQIILFYDQGGFYLWNVGSQQVYPSRLAFEALDQASGQPTDYRFESWRWDEQFPAGYIAAGKCDAIRNLEESLPFPSDCESGGYNATRNTSSSFNPEWGFWLTGAGHEGITQFRVLWRNSAGEEYFEIARCEIAAGRCEVFLPL